MNGSRIFGGKKVFVVGLAVGSLLFGVGCETDESKYEKIATDCAQDSTMKGILDMKFGAVVCKLDKSKMIFDSQKVMVFDVTLAFGDSKSFNGYYGRDHVMVGVPKNDSGLCYFKDRGGAEPYSQEDAKQMLTEHGVF